MTLKEFKRLMLRNLWLLILIPVLTAASILFFERSKEDEYTSTTTIFTGVASGYRIAGDNNEGFKLATENAFGNFNELILARDTQEEVIYKLLANHLMLTAPNPEVLSEANYERLQNLFPQALRAKLVGATVEETLENIREYSKTGTKNEIKNLINSGDPLYSFAALSKVVTGRVGTSEMVKVDYTSNDPAVSQQTLELLIQVFSDKHKELLANKTKSVISFFEAAKDSAHERLIAAEQKLLEFHRTNRIVNYEDQIATTSEEKSAATTKYYNLEMEYAGAFANLKTVEQNLKNRGVVNLHNQEILRLRNQLSKVTSEIAETQLFTKANTDGGSKLARLKQQEQELTNDIKEAINKLYADSHFVTGATSEGLLEEWIKNSIVVEQLKSQLNTLRRQKAFLTGEYDKLVPLGAEIRNIRREIEVAEKEYLVQMQGLNQSMLTQQNIELASQLKVLDSPSLPGAPANASMIPLLIFGFFGSLFLTVSGVVANSMLSSTLKTPSSAAKATNLPVLGAIPVIGSKKKQLVQGKKAESQLARQILLKYNLKQGLKEPFIVGVLSSHSGEGKSTICTSLATTLNDYGIDTLVSFPNSHTNKNISYHKTSFYTPQNGVTPSITVTELIGSEVLDNSIVIVEFPAVLEETYPISLLRHLDLVLVAVKANRAWEQADKTVFKNIQAIAEAPLELVLNGVAVEYAEDFVGTGVARLPEGTSTPEEPTVQYLQEGEFVTNG